MAADPLTLLVGGYLGGALVAAWVMFLSEGDFDELGTNLLLIFAWPLMMALTIGFSIYDGMKRKTDA